ncbi:MAG: hypothetical protein V7731_01160 [Amphritea sp.]
MPTSTCNHCGSKFKWKWEDYFVKVSFDNFLRQSETWTVVSVLTKAGYEVEASYDIESPEWGRYETTIFSIKKDGHELMPVEGSKFTAGYDDPREYLPKEIIELLDKELPA